MINSLDNETSSISVMFSNVLQIEVFPKDIKNMLLHEFLYIFAFGHDILEYEPYVIITTGENNNYDMIIPRFSEEVQYKFSKEELLMFLYKSIYSGMQITSQE